MPLDAPTGFTPIASLMGGVLIGLAAILVMGLFGRIAGVAGITSGAALPARPDWGWRVAFLVGLVAAPFAYLLATGAVVEQTVSSDLPMMGLAGLLVGAGSVYGSGCTSGHGVCGLARFSPRSLAAVAIFMLTAAATVYVVRHAIG